MSSAGADCSQHNNNNNNDNNRKEGRKEKKKEIYINRKNKKKRRNPTDDIVVCGEKTFHRLLGKWEGESNQSSSSSYKTLSVVYKAGKVLGESKERRNELEERKRKSTDGEARLAKLPVTAQGANNPKDVDFAFG